MLRTTRPTPARRGFTLVELLVAAALTIAIMAVIAVAFQAALKAYSDLNAVANLADQLRAAEAVIGRDLEADHLEDEDGKVVRVSAATGPWTSPKAGFFFVGQGSQPKQNVTSPQTAGPNNYQAVQAADPVPYPYLWEGLEDGKPSFRATDHLLHMTVRLAGDKPENAFAAVAPTGSPAGSTNDLVNNPMNLKDLDPTQGQFVSRWAEVAYFLVPSGPGVLTSDDGGTTTPLQLFTLRRRQWVLTPLPVQLVDNPPGQQITPANFPDLSVSETQITPFKTWMTNSPATVTVPVNRWGGSKGIAPGPVTNSPLAVQTVGGFPTGQDILLANVVSCRVRVMSGAPVLRPVMLPAPSASATPPWYQGNFYDFPGTFHDLGFWIEDSRYAPPPSPPSYPAVFDTALAPASLPQPAAAGTAHPAVPPKQRWVPQLRAVEIELRVYDQKTHLTRQVTIRRDL